MIRLENISKVYNQSTINQVNALKNVNIQIERGDFVAITGPSGSGKSTLLHILAGIDEASAGKYFFEGIDVSKLSDCEKCKLRNKKIAIILQTFGLIGEETVLRNMYLPQIIGKSYTKETKQKAMEILKQVGLDDVGNKFVNQLSGGQRQRVAIARALLMDADVLLADEPTGALDMENTNALMELLMALNQTGLTVVVVTHNTIVAEQCTSAYSIIDGNLAKIR